MHRSIRSVERNDLHYHSIFFTYSDSLNSIPPDGFKLDEPKLNDGSGRNRTGVTLLWMEFLFETGRSIWSWDDLLDGTLFCGVLALDRSWLKYQKMFMIGLQTMEMSKDVVNFVTGIT